MDLPLSVDAEIDRLAHTIALQLAAKIKPLLIQSLTQELQEVAVPLPPIVSTTSTPKVEVEVPAPSLPIATVSAPDGDAAVAAEGAAPLKSGAEVVALPSEDMISALFAAADEAVRAGIRVDDLAAYLGMPEHPTDEVQAIKLAAFRVAVKQQTRRLKEEDKAQRAGEAAARRAAKIAERRKKEEDALKQRREALDAAARKKTAEPPVPAVSRDMEDVNSDDRRRVMIVGLLPAQNTIIKQEFGKVFDLAFFSSDRIAGLRNASQNVDLVVTMTDFISHAHEENVQHCENRRRVAGGMTRLRNTLREYYNEAYLSKAFSPVAPPRNVRHHATA